MKQLVEKWLLYSPVGSKVLGTRFVPFKVPISDDLISIWPQYQFTPQHLIMKNPHVKLVIDLTCSSRFYKKHEFIDQGVEHVKLMTPAKYIPQKKTIYKFFEVVDKFILKNKENSALIGVHCTHGVNRTGYFIGSYMIQRLGLPYEQVVSSFHAARGHSIERPSYLEDLGKQKFIPNYDNIYFGKEILQSWIKSTRLPKNGKKMKKTGDQKRSNYLYSLRARVENERNSLSKLINKQLVKPQEVDNFTERISENEKSEDNRSCIVGGKRVEVAEKINLPSIHCKTKDSSLMLLNQPFFNKLFYNG